MANALTHDMIREKRIEAEKGLREAEMRTKHWQNVLSDLDASERVLTLFDGDDKAQIRKANQSKLMIGKTVAVSAKPSGQMFYGGGAGFSVRNPFRAGTNKAFIWEVLDQSEQVWLNANQIQEAASRMKGEVIPMVSISPMLSDMKGEHIERDNLLVALKSRLNENGEASASPDVGEVAASSDL